MRTRQTFYQELFLPFIIVLLFVAIGQADFLAEGPGVDLTAESYNKGVLYYNDLHSPNFVQLDPTNPDMSIPLVPVDPEEFVNNNMMCEDLGCESKAVWTKKEKIAIDPTLVAPTEKNQSK